MERIEAEIGEWRAFIERSPAVDNGDVDELEAHLRDQMSDLTSVGLAPDEAFLIAVKRMGSLSELSREFAQEHSGRLWRQLVDSESATERQGGSATIEMLGFALGAAIALQLARLAAGFPTEEPTWLLRNLSLFVLPFLAGYFIRRRGLSARQILITGLPFAVAAIVINVYPFTEGGSTELLVAAHLPVVMWFAVAFPYMGGTAGSPERRMDFVRFTGEWVIYYVLIALGGGVLTALTGLILEPTGVIDSEQIAEWVLPSGAAGAVIVAAWLVESKQRVVENMAPVLTLIFTPLFGLMLMIAAVLYLVTGLGGAFDRELLGIFDALLVVVLGLVLYGISARDTTKPPDWMDRIQLLTVLSALLLDLVVLGAMLARIGDLGFTPNRTAAIGLNLVLLVNLVGAAWLSALFVAGRGSFHRVERWQTAYLPVFAIWAAAVVVVLPPLFSFA
jgi:hypothetical protein